MSYTTLDVPSSVDEARDRIKEPKNLKSLGSRWKPFRNTHTYTAARPCYFISMISRVNKLKNPKNVGTLILSRYTNGDRHACLRKQSRQVARDCGRDFLWVLLKRLIDSLVPDSQCGFRADTKAHYHHWHHYHWSLLLSLTITLQPLSLS